MKTILLLAATAAVAFLPFATTMAQDATSDQTSMESMQFDKATWVKTVASSNRFEIQSSQMALERGASQDVKAFAQQMIDDHTLAGEKFAATLQSVGDAPPPVELLPKHAEVLQNLDKSEGADFDKAYLDAQLKAHEEAVAVFKSYADKPDDEKLGAFARDTLPTLQEHLEHVQSMVKM